MNNIERQILTQYRKLFDSIPIVGQGSLPLKMEKDKMVILAYIMARNAGINFEYMLEKMCVIRGFSKLSLFSVPACCKETGVSLDYVNDWSKIQLLYENSRIEELEQLLLNVNL